MTRIIKGEGARELPHVAFTRDSSLAGGSRDSLLKQHMAGGLCTAHCFWWYGTAAIDQLPKLGNHQIADVDSGWEKFR